MNHCSAASFEEFFDAERARLFGALSVMTGNRHEAEEIMQDAFLKLWERWVRVSAMGLSGYDEQGERTTRTHGKEPRL